MLYLDVACVGPPGMRARATERDMSNEPEPVERREARRIRWIAILPLVVVGVLNKLLTDADANVLRPDPYDDAGRARSSDSMTKVTSVAAIWARRSWRSSLAF